MKFDLAVNQPPATRAVKHFQTSQNAHIFQLPLEAFPGFWTYAYFVIVDDYRVLIDVGSGYGVCNQQLLDRLAQVDASRPEIIDLEHLTHIFITHGHIDHFGGLSFVRNRSPSLVGVHELDLRNLTNTEERLMIVSKRLNLFLAEAGIQEQRREHLIQLYRLSKLNYVPVAVDFTYEGIGMQLGPFEFLHTPGHCAGQVVIRLHEFLFSGDHILSTISPHQAPERLVLNTGLGHYFQSLAALEEWSNGINVSLGGHNDVITNLHARIDAIRNVHEQRLDLILNMLSEPHTISEIAAMLFHDAHGYNELLAIEEAGAHVEYLYQRGRLGIENLNAMLTSDEVIPIHYCRI